jgi:hypothetical protein
MRTYPAIHPSPRKTTDNIGYTDELLRTTFLVGGGLSAPKVAVYNMVSLTAEAVPVSRNWPQYIDYDVQPKDWLHPADHRSYPADTVWLLNTKKKALFKYSQTAARASKVSEWE